MTVLPLAPARSESGCGVLNRRPPRQDHVDGGDIGGAAEPAWRRGYGGHLGRRAAGLNDELVPAPPGILLHRHQLDADSRHLAWRHHTANTAGDSGQNDDRHRLKMNAQLQHRRAVDAGRSPELQTRAGDVDGLGLAPAVGRAHLDLQRDGVAGIAAARRKGHRRRTSGGSGTACPSGWRPGDTGARHYRCWPERATGSPTNRPSFSHGARGCGGQAGQIGPTPLCRGRVGIRRRIP